MTPRRKRSTASKTEELEFDTTQEIDPALVDSILSRSEPTLLPGDFDDTEILLDVTAPTKTTPRR